MHVSKDETDSTQGPKIFEFNWRTGIGSTAGWEIRAGQARRAQRTEPYNVSIGRI